MKTDTLMYIKRIIHHEGFHGAFMNYFHPEDVKDKKFQLLRNQYVKAVNDLQAFLEEMEEQVCNSHSVDKHKHL
jgi:hypothetical protein